MEKKKEIVVDWLKTNGYRRVHSRETEQWIEADSSLRKMAVKIGVFETTELQNFKNEAKSAYREPWIATVDVQDDNYVGWKHLID